MNEGKRGFKNKKQALNLEKTKQRNPVAKNATAGFGGGAAGAHDPKKHTRKEKHKKTMADMAEGASYDRALELKLQIALVENAIMERDPAAYAAAARRSIFQNIGAGAMRDPSDPVRVKADRAIANRERGLERQRARFDAKQAAQPAAPAPDVEKMKATLANLEIQFDNLGGDSYQYADRMTDRDIEARDIHRRILSLRGAIERAGGEVDEANQFFKPGPAVTGNFPEPRKPRPGEEHGPFSKSETLGRDGLIYHWQDPRARQGKAPAPQGSALAGTTSFVNGSPKLPAGINGEATCKTCGTAFNKHFRFDQDGKPTHSLVRHPMTGGIAKYFPDLKSPVAEARANTASARASLEKRKTKAPLTPEEQRAKDAAKFEKWKAKNQKPEKVAENDLRNPKLVWGPGVRNEVDPEGRSTKFVPKTGTYRVHTGAVGPDQVKQDIKQRIKKGGIAGPKHRLPKE